MEGWIDGWMDKDYRYDDVMFVSYNADSEDGMMHNSTLATKTFGETFLLNGDVWASEIDWDCFADWITCGDAKRKSGQAGSNDIFWHIHTCCIYIFIVLASWCDITHNIYIYTFVDLSCAIYCAPCLALRRTIVKSGWAAKDLVTALVSSPGSLDEMRCPAHARCTLTPSTNIYQHKSAQEKAPW